MQRDMILMMKRQLELVGKAMLASANGSFEVMDIVNERSNSEEY